MAICYAGPTSPRPGRRACGAVNSQADTTRWYATDCSRCKARLEDMLLVAGDARGLVLGVHGDRVRMLRDDPSGRDVVVVGLSEVDSSWRRA